MKAGEKLKTKYFSEYTEEEDNDVDPVELVGVVTIGSRTKKYCRHVMAFLVTDSGRKYDLPIFMEKYASQRVAVLGRVWSIEDGERIYDKIAVIVARPIYEEPF